MKNLKVLVFALTGFALVVTGCAKKSTEQASISGTGFDTISSTEELAQLPQSSTASQQAGVEVLPIETSPITQSGMNVASTTEGLAAAASTIDLSGLTKDQQIQTALKNAGLYQGAIDGKIGPATKRAIQEFQTSQNLKVDGKVGPQTWAALAPYISGAPESASTQTTQE